MDEYVEIQYIVNGTTQQRTLRGKVNVSQIQETGELSSSPVLVKMSSLGVKLHIS